MDTFLKIGKKHHVSRFKITKLILIFPGKDDVMCIHENWIRTPPNVLFFAINRLKYDVKKGKQVKD